MKEDRDQSTVWDRYVSAKEAAFGRTDGDDEPLTLEELEAEIAKAAAIAGLPETGMPPRSEVHPVKRRPLSKWFYLALVLLFAALVAGLFWWGRQQYAVNEPYEEGAVRKVILMTEG
ncbi:hypothetical protein ACF3MZ_06835 [Paenibacillaceae bacterium WGS1546]|uniref:hypothetical protein n=1 Tax=Cohnella sp. WGS1546 TaxID=3366810 RepID=UPI00372D5BF7